MGSRCTWPELQCWAPNHAGCHRTHRECDVEKALCAAKRGQTKECRRQKYLSGLAGIHGVIREEICSIRSPDCRRLLRNRSEERRVGKECRSRWSPYH